MSEAKHTPGPWELDELHDRRLNIRRAGYSEPFMAYQPLVNHSVRGNALEQLQANARLIAAAPELLAACEEMLAVVDEAYQATGYIKIAKTSEQRMRLQAAIAKATGDPAV